MSTLTFPSQEWLDHFCSRLNESTAFSAATANWNDDAAFVIDSDPDAGFNNRVTFHMRWQNGKIVNARAICEPTTLNAVFVVRAPYSVWAEVHRARMEPGVAFLTGKFLFEGAFLKAAANLAGEVLMLQTAYDVPTHFEHRSAAAN